MAQLDHNVLFHACGVISMLILIPLLFIEQDNLQATHLHASFLADEFKTMVTVSFAISFPLIADLIIDVATTKTQNFGAFYPRVAICCTLLLTASLHLHFSVRHGNGYASWVIFNMQVVVCITIGLHQAQMRFREMGNTPIFTYFNLCMWNGGTIMKCYGGQNSTTALIGNIMRGIGFVCTQYDIFKHLLLVTKGQLMGEDTHAKWQQVAFKLLVGIGFTFALVVEVVTQGNSMRIVSRRELLLISYEMVAFLVLMSLIITNEHRHDLAKAKLKLKVKRMFVRFVSHEVRTPLSSCMMGIAYMKEAIKHPTAACIKEIAGILDEVSEGCGTAIDFMNNLLMYEKIDTMELPMYLKMEDLIDVCSEVVNSFQMTARHLDISLTLDVHDSLLKRNELSNAFVDVDSDGNGDKMRAMADIDAPKMVIVLRNLLSNALKFTPQHGKVSLSIKPINMSLEAQDNNKNRNISTYPSAMSASLPCDTTHFRVILSDTGRGMTQQEQKQLFTKIVQFSPNENQKGGGSGIGLYLSHQIIKDHKLKIQIYSESVEGKGSQFFIDFPYKKLSPAALADESIWSTFRSHFSSREPRIQTSALRGEEEEKGDDDDEVLAIMELGGASGLVPSEDSEETMDPLHSCRMSLPNVVSLPSTPINKNKDPDSFRLARNMSYTLGYASSSRESKGLSDLDILIVDDSFLNRKMLVRTLVQNHIGASFKHLSDGVDLLAEFGVSADNNVQDDDDSPEALTWRDSVRVMPVLLNESKYDVIVLDDNMIRMNGSVAIEKLRAAGYIGLVIGLTGSAMEDDLITFCRAAADVALPKPFIVNDFIDVLNQHSFHF